MNCPKCGTFVEEDSQICLNCGSPLELALSSYEQLQCSEQPEEPLDSSPQPNDRPKKNHIRLIIAIAVSLIIIVSLALMIFGSLSFFKPKDLGVRYTLDNYQSALKKTGINIYFNNMTQDELDNYKNSLNGKKLNADNYKCIWGNYKPKTFTLTSSEATALLNEVAPNFCPFDDIQLNVLPNGDIESSGKADIAFLDATFKSNIAEKLPLGSKVNVYIKGTYDITDNKIAIDPEVVDVGFIPIKEKYVSDKNINAIEKSFNKVLKSTKNLQINSLEADGEGNLVFDGIIPQSVTITKK